MTSSSARAAKSRTRTPCEAPRSLSSPSRERRSRRRCRRSADLDGKIVVDITNRYVDGGLEGVPARYAHELLQEWAPGARVVKAFNHVGAARLTQPQVGGETPSVLIAGDDVEAKEVVAGLAREIGFEPVDVGPRKPLGR